MRFPWPFLLLALTAAADEAADVACLLSARRPRRKRRHERQYQQGDKNLSDWHYDSEGGTRQDIIIDKSEVYGNVIAGNNAGDIHSNFVENTVRDRSISAGDTEFLPGFFMNRAVRKAGQRLKRKEPAPARPLEEEYIKDFINSPQREALSTLSFLVDLKLNEALPKALQAVNLPRNYPEQVEYMLEKVNETCKRRTGNAVVVYLQLTTKSRGDKFSRDACDDIASTLGAFARNITYDNAACKFILEVSVSAVADIIKERFNMSRLVVVRPLPSEDFTSVVKEVAKQGNDFRTLNKVLADDKIEEVLKHYYIRTGGNFRDLGEILENVSREGQKGADVVIKRVEQWYKRRVEPIQRKLDDQEVKDYLLKVAEAGPMGYLPESDEDTKMALKLLREEPADCVLRSTTSETVALKHWHFVAKLFQEDEQKLRDAGYMWSHDVFMPIGNTFKRFSVSANGTNINHTVNTDLGDNNTHTLGESATSRSFEDIDDSDDDT
ncbi:unnamed protein product [Cladocopium goreaui]|uniref:Uncharacterized protein n=1 Tax=Cladocopium goreaui TaxID=2562237 RepID=A0A9P1FG48_9DINO|nr:unnamed protein product [Cladocopium goreaui]